MSPSRRKAESGDILDVVGRIYDAALRPNDFSDALAAIGRSINAKTGAFIVEDLQKHRLVSSATLDITPEQLEIYERDWLLKDVGLHDVLPRLPEGALATDEDVPHFRRLEIYEKWFRPEEMDHMVGCLPAKEEDLLGLVAFHRPRRKGPFRPDELARLRSLIPHLARAATLQRHLLDAQSKAALSATALDELATGVVIVDAKGIAKLVNRAAHVILTCADGLVLGRRGVRAVRADEDAQLQALIHGATVTGSRLGADAGGVVRISRPSLRRSLVVLVSPIRSDTPFLRKEDAAAVIFIRDPEGESETAPRSLQRLFGLTATEARVCSELVHGKSIGEISDQLRLARDTVRKHVKQIFAKTGTNRQAGLATLILSTLVGLRAQAGPK